MPHGASPSVPIAIYASRVGTGEVSRRPRHTAEPLVELLEVADDHRCGHDCEHALVGAPLDAPATVLVCGRHGGIPNLSSVVTPRVATPEAWPGYRFDLVRALDQNGRDGSWPFAQVLQMLFGGGCDTTA